MSGIKLYTSVVMWVPSDNTARPSTGLPTMSATAPLTPASSSPGLSDVNHTLHSASPAAKRAQRSSSPEGAAPKKRRLTPNTKLSPSENGHGPAPAGTGPMSKIHNVAARPKPGRKPATDEPANKRKAQNRTSQRAFRDRKAAKMTALQETVRIHQENAEQRENELLSTIADLERLVRAKDEEIAYLKRQNGMQSGVVTPVQLAQASQYAQCSQPLNYNMDSFPGNQSLSGYATPNNTLSFCPTCASAVCACPQEMDFTHRYQASSTQAGLFTAMHDETEVHDCGFCDSNPDMCLCKDVSLRLDAENSTVPLPRSASIEPMDDVKPLPAMTGPGSCADCQTNPEQRAWCQRIAQLRSEATPPRSRRGSSKSISLDVMEPKIDTRTDLNKVPASPVLGESSVACNTAFKIFEGRVPMDDRMDWRKLKPMPPSARLTGSRRDTFTMEPGTFSAMELDASSILATLQHSKRPLEPRPSDGAHANLVRIAEERRRATRSPV